MHLSVSFLAEGNIKAPLLLLDHGTELQKRVYFSFLWKHYIFIIEAQVVSSRMSYTLTNTC